MKKLFLRLPEDMTPQARSAFQVAAIMAVSNGLFIPFFIFLVFQRSGEWQLWAALILDLSVFLNTLVGGWLIRRGQVKRGTQVVLYGMILAIAIVPFFIADMGVLLGITSAVLVIALAAQLFDRPEPAIIAGFIGGTIAVAADLFLPAYRLSVPELQVYVPLVTGLVVVVFGFLALRRFQEYSLRTKLVIAFFAVVVASVGIVGFFVNRSLRAGLTEQISASLAELAGTKAVEIGQAVDREADILKTLAFDTAIQEAAQAANWSNTLSQAEIEGLDQQWRAADAANNNVDPLVAGVLNNSLAADLRQFREEFPQHVEVFVTDKQGVNIASTNRTSDYYQADEEWWQAAYQEGLYIGQPEYDESSETVAITMAVPVRAKGSGSIAGILRTTVNFEALKTSLVAGLFGETGHTDIYLPSGQKLELEAGEDGTFDLLLEEDPLGASTLAQSEETYLEINHHGVPTLAGQALMTVQGDADEDELAITNLNWRVVVFQDQAEALRSAETQTRNILFLAFGITIGAIIAAVGLAQLISGPILRLKTTAEQVAAGDLSIQAEVETGDETGILASTFNTMTAQLRESFNTLEQRVAERTQNLELAAEVGRSISQVRALDVMLKDACQLILDEFDLYYVQVYLADPSQTKLVLTAGTGDVGAQLLERGHSLPFNTGSINGRAAVEKRTVLISDTAENINFRPNALLPETRGEMAVPLIVGERVVGVLDMQSNQPGVLNEEVLPAFEALAGQLAVAVQNANLVAEAEQARAEVEAQARRLVRTGWSEHLDAVHKPEHLGFVFDRNEVAPLDEADELPGKGQAVSAPISITGETLGSLVVELEEDNQNEQTNVIVNTVARQVAQQIENLRLLESAERYRFEAEQAVRRQTRQNWREYASTKAGESLGFLYDLNEVRPYNNGHDAETTSLNLPLKVRNETVGKLAVQGLSLEDKDSLELVNVIAERLGAHIEGLRLTQQIQSRAQREQALRQITNAVRSSTDLTTILRTAVRELGTVMGRRAVIRMAMPEQSDEENQVHDKNGSSENADGGMS